MVNRMVNYFTGATYASRRMGALLLALGLVLWALPAEATMGDLIRAVYVHGALLRGAELAFVAGAVLGMLYLLRGTDSAVHWSWALQKTAALSWFLSLAISMYTMRVAWGGVNWAEPRFVAAGRVLSAVVVAIALGHLLERPRATAAIGIVLGALVAVEVSTTGVVLHPVDPIGASPSLAIKAYYYAIVLLFLALVAETARLVRDTDAQATREH